MFSIEEREHYSRHFLLLEMGEVGQQKLKNAQVLVVGSGGLGCACLNYLVAAGIGNVSLVDGDIVSRSNLQRQVLFRDKDVGKPKVQVASQTLRELNPHIKIETLFEHLKLGNVEKLIPHYDVVVDCSDNFETRYLINDACVKYSVPLSYAAISKFEGQSAFFSMKKNSPCLRCVFPKPPKLGSILNCAEAGVLGVLPGIFGALQARDVILFLLGNLQSKRFSIWNVVSDERQSFEMLADAQCEICAAEPRSKIDLDFFHGAQVSLYENLISKNPEIKSISPFDLVDKMQSENFLWIDVREFEEVKACALHGLKNKIHIPLGILKDALNSVSRKHTLIVYCRSGARSKIACGELIANGFENVLNMDGGLLQWKNLVDANLSQE